MDSKKARESRAKEFIGTLQSHDRAPGVQDRHGQGQDLARPRRQAFETVHSFCKKYPRRPKRSNPHSLLSQKEVPREGAC